MILIATMLSHLTVVLPFTQGFALLGAPWPLAFGVALAGLLAWLVRGRVQAVIWDTPRPAWRLLYVDEPYYAHWCATFVGGPLQLLLLLGSLGLDLALGRPLHLPGTASLGLYLFMLTLGFYSVKIRRRWVRIRRHDVEIDGLDPAFDGYRIVQLSDLHIGGMLPPGLGERWVAMANAEAADLTVVTGDLVTSGVNFHDEIAALLARLTARDDVVVSMGNHDYFGEGDPLIDKMRAAGLTVLRNDSQMIRRGSAQLRLSAVDDLWTARADLARTLAGPKPAPTVLLAHDPKLFDQAADLGADFMLSGHTHAGQLALPFLVRQVNLAKIAYAYTYGFYRRGRATLYVHAGLGTTGPPARFGAAPELAVFTLRPTPGRPPAAA